MSRVLVYITARFVMPSPSFTVDEVAMLRFLQLCVGSLDPENFENVLNACRALAFAHATLDEGSILKCLKQILGDDYEEPVTQAARPASPQDGDNPIDSTEKPC